MYKSILFLLFCLLTGKAMASPVAQLNKVGEGEMTYLFWTLYHAQYYRGTVTEQGAKVSKQALKIRYMKSIDNKDLVEATIDQWQHLGYPNEDIAKWAAPLNSLWPDVEPGETLTLVVKPGGESRFYFNDGFIGAIYDTSFADAFLSIWLSEKTSEPKLRRKLLGLAQ